MKNSFGWKRFLKTKNPYVAGSIPKNAKVLAFLGIEVRSSAPKRLSGRRRRRRLSEISVLLLNAT
jgi:hypothetical protein